MCQTWVAASPLNHDGGVLYLSSISEEAERVGVAHIYIWDKSAMGQPEINRRAALGLMERHRLDRIICEIDVDNKMAINLAKKAGFHEIGIIRQRGARNGGKHNVMALDALPGDLDG